MAIQRLTAAYRSRSRPSSTLGAKASTMCPYYLDGDPESRRAIPLGEIFDFSQVIAVGNYPDTRVIGYCAVFKVREEAKFATRRPGTSSSEPPAASRSLKTQQHASRLACACGLPDPVDIV